MGILSFILAASGNVPEITAGGIIGTVLGLLAWARSSRGKSILRKFKIVELSTNVAELTASLKSMEEVSVMNRGSIEFLRTEIVWLRTELSATRADLAGARSALNAREGRLEKDLAAARAHIIVLEGRIRDLQAQIDGKQDTVKE